MKDPEDIKNELAGYNVCDIVRFNRKDIAELYPNTIAHEYVKNVRSDLPQYTVDYELLQQIVDSVEAPEPCNDAFYMHCRVGDIFGYMKNGINNHHYPWVDTVFSIIQDNNLNKIYRKCVIVTGSHKKHRLDESKEYLDNLTKMLTKFGIKYEFVSNEADVDCALLSRAKCYIAGYRGFGWLTACMNKHKVFWDIQKPPFFYWESRRGRKRTYIWNLTEGYRYQQARYRAYCKR